MTRRISTDFGTGGATTALMLALIASACPARADQPDDGGWISPTQYLTGPHTAGAAISSAAPATPVAAVTPAPSSAKTAIADPARPVNIPFLTTRSSSLSVKVESTAPAEAATDRADALSGTPLPDWHGVADASRDAPVSADALPVRPSFLPNVVTRQQPTPDYVSGTQLARKALAQGLNKQSKPEPPKAACAAIDAFQKKQLKDLQSDQRTLQALRAAVSSLGLEKQLSFLSDPNGAKSDADKVPAAN